MILPPRYAVMSAAAYILIGLAGVPVFAGYVAGAGVFVGPTGGFLAAYPIMAFVVAIGAKKGLNKERIFTIALAVAMSLLICYGLGSFWYSVWANISIFKAAAVAALPFLPFDAAKAIIAAFIAVPVRKFVTKGE
jgi:biotin transport system substrate-specific component